MSEHGGQGRPGGGPVHGNVGPDDPTADPVTEPGVRLPVPAEQPTAPVPVPLPGPAAGPTGPAPEAPATGTAPAVRRSRTGVVWVGLIFSAIVLLLLLVFILQNNAPVQISFFALEGVLPSGVALLLAAIAGILLGAIPGSLRIFQLRRAARRNARPRT
jgi:uncharacterized integral membrane protein